MVTKGRGFREMGPYQGEPGSAPQRDPGCTRLRPPELELREGGDLGLHLGCTRAEGLRRELREGPQAAPGLHLGQACGWSSGEDPGWTPAAPGLRACSAELREGTRLHWLRAHG